MNPHQDQTLISVVIPTFNRFEVTCKAIDSVLEQTHQNVEVIVVDDVSTDGSFDRLQALYSSKSNKVRLIQNPVNAGAATGRNNGTDVAKGEFIAFLNSDDIWLKEKLELQLKDYQALTKQANNIILYSPSEFQSPQGYRINPTRPLETNEKVEEYMFIHGQAIQTSGWFMSKKIFDQVKFTNNLLRHQDYDFVIRAQALGIKFRMSDKPLYSRGRGDHQQHVGTIRDDGFSQKWIDMVKPYISRKAYYYFVLNIIVPVVVKRAPSEALALVLKAACKGYPSFGKLKYTLLMWLKKARH